MSNAALANATTKLKENTEKVKQLMKVAQNNAAKAVNASTPAAAVAPMQTAALAGNAANAIAVQSQNIAQNAGLNPGSNPQVQNQAKMVNNIAIKNALAANKVAAGAVTAAAIEPSPPANAAANTAVKLATASTTAATSGNVIKANKTAAGTVNAAAVTGANVSPAANKAGANVKKNIKA
jgi:hypothetical protein